MNRFGYIRVATASPAVEVAGCEANAMSIAKAIIAADAQGADVVVLPEMAVTAYTCGDLFHQQLLIDQAVAALETIREKTFHTEVMTVFGAPIKGADGGLYNCAVVMQSGSVFGIVPKSYLPNYNEFYEKRWWRDASQAHFTTVNVGHFENVPFGTDLLFNLRGVKFGVEVCEDLWTAIPPSSRLALGGADVVLNLSASDDLIGKYGYLRSLILQQSARCICGYVYASAGYGESSTDLVFDGKGFIAENGTMLAQSERWSDDLKLTTADIDIHSLRRDRLHSTSWGDCAARESQPMRTIDVDCLIIGNEEQGPTAEVMSERLHRHIDPMPFVPADDSRRNERCTEIVNIQVAALAKRLQVTQCKSLVVGISGGLDSTLALLVAVAAFRRLGLDVAGIVGVTMPGFGTTGRTYNNALALMRALGVTIREIPIAEAVTLHFRDIGHDASVTDVTYENSQARERTQILMDIANQVGGMVLGTGDMSELALGWATYNGDHMSMYGVNAGVPKTLVRHLVRWFADNTDNVLERDTLLDIVDTPISPELTPAAADGTIAQRTEDLVGPYELHDFFLYYTLRHGFEPAKVYMLAMKAFPERTHDEIKHWLTTFYRRFFNQQFKRSCLPDGPKVGSVCLSPRGDWRMPSDATSALWLAQLSTL